MTYKENVSDKSPWLTRKHKKNKKKFAVDALRGRGASAPPRPPVGVPVSVGSPVVLVRLNLTI